MARGGSSAVFDCINNDMSDVGTGFCARRVELQRVDHFHLLFHVVKWGKSGFAETYGDRFLNFE